LDRGAGVHAPARAGGGAVPAADTDRPAVVAALHVVGPRGLSAAGHREVVGAPVALLEGPVGRHVEADLDGLAGVRAEFDVVVPPAAGVVGETVLLVAEQAVDRAVRVLVIVVGLDEVAGLVKDLELGPGVPTV